MPKNFPSFDMNEACEFFDYEDQNQWAKIEPFVVFDCDDIGATMNAMAFVDVSNDDWATFDAGVEHALSRVNRALEAAGVDLRIASSDLGNNMGYVLIRDNDTPETWAKRVFKKPRKVIDTWA